VGRGSLPRATAEQLGHLAPLARLSGDRLAELAEIAFVEHSPRGSDPLQGRAHEAQSIFLLQGELLLAFQGGGTQVMVGGICGVRSDVIPFGLVNGQYASLEGLNIVGMKRRKFTRERLAIIRSFYQKLFHGPGIFAERLSQVQPLAAEDPAIAEILAFIDADRHRALCLPAKNDST